MNQTDNILQSEAGNSIFILTNKVHCIYSCQVIYKRGKEWINHSNSLFSCL